MDGPTLEASPFELGMSRADLWAFAGILALDEAQRTTRTQCDNYNWDTTCGDNSTTCFTPFPKNTETLFKTGRIDCIPSDNHSEKHQYLASKIEDGPDHSGKPYQNCRKIYPCRLHFFCNFLTNHQFFEVCRHSFN